jgi:hypothetical protein
MTLSSFKRSTFRDNVRYENMLVGNPAFIPSSYESIASATGTGSSTTITFSSIPSTYKHLQIRGIGKRLVSTASGGVTVKVTFNSDSGSNYSKHALIGTGSSVAATGSASQTAINIDAAISSSNASYTNIIGVTLIDILDYSNTTKNKTLRAVSGTELNNTNGEIYLTSGLWMNTNAITSITLTSETNNFSSISTYALYGIKG